MASGGDDRGRFIPIGGDYEPVGDDEAAALGHALLAKLRGERLSPEEQALLSRPRSRSRFDARAPTPVVEVAETLASFERGPDAELRLTWRRYKGSTPFLDLRRWERGPGGGMRPTRQGVTLRLRELSRAMSAIVQALQRAERGADYGGGDRAERGAKLRPDRLADRVAEADPDDLVEEPDPDERTR
jgi:hypothetical protein